MNMPLSQEQRQNLGLEGLMIGEGQSIVLARAVAHGLVTEAAADYHAFRELDRSPFQWTPIRELEELGFRLEVGLDRPKIIKVIDETGAPIVVHGIGLVPAAFHKDPKDPSTVFLDLDIPGARTVLRETEAGVLIVPAEQSLTVYPVTGPNLCVEPLSEIRAPLVDWCREVRDAWLVGQFEKAAGSEDSWSHCVAAGMYARLAEPADAAEAEREVKRLLSGRVVDRMAKPLVWAWTLSAEQCATLEDLALAEIDHLDTLLGHLEDEATPEEKGWCEDLLELCRRRDDLEGILLVLAEAGAGQRLARACGGFDRRAEIFSASIPARVSFQDEKLRRAWLGSPEAWWASFSAASPER
jgi:hypothetical protein